MGGQGEQRALEFGAQGVSESDQQYEVSQQINSLRALVEEWRQAPESPWKVTAETARLLKHWRHHEFQGIRPFCCQIEAVEMAIWLMEVAPEIGKRGQFILEALELSVALTRAKTELNLSKALVATYQRIPRGSAYFLQDMPEKLVDVDVKHAESMKEPALPLEIDSGNHGIEF